MNASPSPLFSPFIFLNALLIFSTPFPRYLCYNEDGYSVCQSFDCGEFRGIGYPFWGNQQPDYCGHPKFKLNCDQQNNVTMSIMSQEFHVIDIHSTTQIMKIARMDLWGSSLCPHQYVNTTLDFNYFHYTSNDENSTLLYECDSPTVYPLPNKFTCSNNNVDGDGYFVSSAAIDELAALRCNNRILVPVLSVAIQNYVMSGYSGMISINEVVGEGFEVRWEVDEGKCENCKQSGGRCGNSINGFTCFCSDHKAYPISCAEASAPVGDKYVYSDYPADPANPVGPADPRNTKGDLSKRVKRKIAIGVGGAGAAVILMSVGFFFYLRRYKKRHSLPYTNTRSWSSDPSSVNSKDAEKGSRLFGVHLFTYEELEEATDHFNPSKELGDGGFGTVYYGKLHDGREVAVKRLYENNYKRVEQFMNEVKILTRLRHQNLVSLYGCTSRHCRELLLVYEYISNGTVADHLHGQKAHPGMLPWRIRMNIALETASALSYLHASDIIHRDVKTNNILLDKNFQVKVADFGLSRLFPNDRTHISTAPQGTPGYVDPEYHECYQLTDKSDVYSFGVVLIELISSMPAVDITRHRHEINLSTMAINKIQHGALCELVDPSLGFESNYKVRKMINAVAEVAFQCLQGVKDMRPSMLEVLESLNDIQNDFHKGKAEEMDMREDDAVLLKSEPPPFSPESMASNVRSSTTTPNTSG